MTTDRPRPLAPAAPGHGPRATPRRTSRPGPLARTRRRATAALVGSDPSPGEVAATLVSALAGTALAVGACLAAGLPPAATAVTGLVAFDFFGGAAATSTSAAKRRHHAPGRGLRHHAGFVALHLQPFALALFVPGFAWWAAAALYLYALACAVAVGLTPLPLRVPVAFCATGTGSAAALLFLPAPDALAWLAPVMLVKLLLGHMLPGAAQGEAERGAHGTEEGRPVGAA
ncbi:hypothetical protein Q8791_25165 [Nocardiopsis sp. CT-R113]|uniref:Uncharacterized protein n=1 Tax=Nocardiopsis codii TaxID=3065942 RepID=A0ABU7KE83_9ACTN|nr:hypothetical protein [Nocardiopsis sp. CT-R113]MEE2040517.1 hypothetical protein [Nocardiopsis sp. CT-R113]